MRLSSVARLPMLAVLSPVILLFFYPLGIHHLLLVGIVIVRGRRHDTLPLLAIAVVATYGVLIADDRALAMWSQPARRYGGADWALWAACAVVLAPMLRSEGARRSLLTLVAWAGVSQSALACLEWVWLAIVAGLPFDRLTGLSTNSGFLGMWAMAGALAGVGLARSDKRWAVVAIVCALALVGSGTRAAMLGFGAGLIILVPRPAIAGAVALAIGAAMAERFGLGLDERVRVWGIAWSGFQDQPLGHGWYSFLEEGVVYATGSLPPGIYPYDAPHNMPLHVLYELGVVGLLIFACLALIVLKLRGPWLSVAAGWTVYSLFWLPNPAWWTIGSCVAAVGYVQYVREQAPG